MKNVTAPSREKLSSCIIAYFDRRIRVFMKIESFLIAASELKNGTAPRRVKQKSSVIAHFDHRKNVFNVQLRFLNFIHRKVA